MSKFVDALSKTGEDSVAPLGFGPASGSGKSSAAMVLAGQVTPRQLVDKPALGDSKVDALLVSLGAWDEAALDSIEGRLNERLWGVWLEAVGSEQVKLLREKGCDFVVFDATETEASVLEEEDIGKIMAVASDLDEDVARAINELPIDVVMLASDPDLLPLTVSKLIGIEQVRGMVDKPFVMAVPDGLAAKDLEILRNVGISGLVVATSSLKEIRRTKEAIEGLPRPKVRATRARAAVPHIGPEPPGDQPDPGEDDDEGDEF